MKICFILPGSGQNPVGGLKVAYEYANGLVHRGHAVTVIHAPYGLHGGMPLRKEVKRLLVYIGRKFGFKGGYLPNEWFSADPRVQMQWVPSLQPRWIPQADAVIATGWHTAEWVAGYPGSKGRKYYLIQHQEASFADADPDRAMATWKRPLQKIVIARWLEDIAARLNEHAVYIPNGLDFNAFGLDTPVVERDPHQLIMLYHDQAWKGSEDALEAMASVRSRVPELRATLFGVPPRPVDLPRWINYVQKPEQTELRRLYNNAAIFVGPSWAEGWPLPPAEAAQCGAALCLTDIGGHREYAVHSETALLSPPREPDALANNIIRLISDNALRRRLASTAHEHILQFTWERAVSALEKCLLESR